MAKKTPNPYDRRERARHQFHDVLEFREAAPEESAITLEDLQALAAHVRRRTAVKVTAEQQQRREQAVADASREAWDEGHAAGFADGERAVLDRMLARFGEVVQEVLADSGQVLADADAAAEQLRPVLARMRRVVFEAREAHEFGFRLDSPRAKMVERLV